MKKSTRKQAPKETEKATQTPRETEKATQTPKEACHDWYMSIQGGLQARRIDLRRLQDVIKILMTDIEFWEDAAGVVKSGRINPIGRAVEENHRLLVREVEIARRSRNLLGGIESKIIDRIIEATKKDIHAHEDEQMVASFEGGTWTASIKSKKKSRSKRGSRKRG